MRTYIKGKGYQTVDDWFKSGYIGYGSFAVVDLFNGSIQRTDKYGNKLYLHRVGDKIEVTTEVTSIPYMYPKLYDNSSDLANIFLMHKRDAYLAYPCQQIGESDADVCRESAILLDSDIISFCLENRYKYLGLLDTMFQDYDPITNYDMIEHGTETPTGSTTNTKDYTPDANGVTTKTGKVDANGNIVAIEKGDITSTTSSSIDETADGQEIKTYTTTYDDDNQDRLSTRQTIKGMPTTGEETTTEETSAILGQNVKGLNIDKEVDTVTFDNRVDTHHLERHGNIGVTTTQDMLESERKIRNFSILKIFIEDLSKIITLGVY